MDLMCRKGELAKLKILAVQVNFKICCFLPRENE